MRELRGTTTLFHHSMQNHIQSITYLKLGGNNQLRCLKTHEHVEAHERHDGHEDGEITDELTQLDTQ